MRTRSMAIRLAAALAVTTVMVGGCDSAEDTAPPDTAGTPSDINPRDVADLRDGGNLRLAISALPTNWNTMEVDGNDADVVAVEAPTLPVAFSVTDSGETQLDTDYFTDVRLTGTNPQRVTYTINPKATWSDGTPITWADIASEAHALSGRDPAYLIAGNNGFDRVAKVERGVDDRQAILTYAQNFTEWRGQFAARNNFLYPRSVTATPEAFNKSLLNGIPVTAGPFMVKSVDRGQGRIVLGRNPAWWGAAPKLSTVTFSVLDSSATVPALQNHEIDAVPIGSRDDLKTARRTSGVAIRRAPSNTWGHLTFNGAPGSILEDPRLRVAIMKAIDRQGIVNASQNGLVAHPVPLGNHVYVRGQDGYQDNSIPFDPPEAARELDALGWKLDGGVRKKNGRTLQIRDVMYEDDGWIQIAQIIQQNLQQIGVKLIIDTKPGKDYFSTWIIPGDFDLGQWSWVGNAFPLSSLPQIWGLDPNNVQGNYGHIGSAELNDKIDKTLSELDPVRARQLANEVDKQIWAEGHSMPLSQSPGNVAVRDNLANFGAFGLASVDWTKVGFLK